MNWIFFNNCPKEKVISTSLILKITQKCQIKLCNPRPKNRAKVLCILKNGVLALNQKLRTTVHPDSPEMQQLMRDKLHVAGKYMDEWKTEAKRKYSDLETEFREALCLEDNEKKKLKTEIDRIKDEYAQLRINQEKLYFSERKARETLELVTKQANEFRHKNDVAEDKISRLVDGKFYLQQLQYV